MADTNDDDADEQWWKTSGIARFELDYDDGDEDGDNGNGENSVVDADSFAEFNDD